MNQLTRSPRKPVRLTKVTDAERWSILRRYDVRWIVVDRRQRSPRFVEQFRRTYADARYRLYRVTAPRPAVRRR